MSAFGDDPKQHDESPNEEVWSVVQDVLSRRSRGETISDESVLEQHPDLAPQLEEYLNRAKRVAEARTSSSFGELPDLDGLVRRESLPRQFGEFELVSVISRGGMGTVYRAMEIETGNVVALKMIRGQGFASPESIRRFRNESESMAALSHENVVTVFEVGSIDQQHYYSMEFIDGESLADVISRAPLSGPVAADLMIPIVDAVATAHQHGIIHRDLKPSNVIVDKHGTPHIADFGLAKQLNRDSSTTYSGQVIGSASYMSPEQALGKHEVVDERSDVYGLGAILYEMLTRRAPFSAESVPLTLLQVIKDIPISPRALNRNIARDLETICLRCLDKRPSRRYASALQLKDDLQRWRANKSIKASPITITDRVSRRARSDPRLAVAVCAAGLFFVSVLCALAWGNWQTGLALEQAKQSSQIAKRSLYLTHMNLAQRAWENGNINYVTKILLRYQTHDPENDLRGFEWYYLWRLANQTNASIETRDVWFCCDYSADGQLVVGGKSGEVRRYDALSLKQLDRIAAHQDWIPSIVLNRAGTRYATACYDGSLQIRSLASGKLLMEFAGHRDSEEPHVNEALFAEDSNRLISAGRDGTIREWDLATGDELPRRFVGHTDRINDLDYCSTTNRLASVSRNRQVFLWDDRSGELFQSYPRQGESNGHNDYIDSVLLLSEFGQLVTSDTAGFVVVWDLETAKVRKKIRPHEAAINAFAIAPDKTKAVTVSADGSISIFQLPEWDVLAIRRGHRRAVKDAKFVSNDQFVSVGEGGSIRWWETAQEFDTHLAGHGDTVWNVDVSEDGRLLASVGADGRTCIWRLDDHQVAWETQQPSETNAVSFSSDASRVATACDDGYVRVYRVADGTLLAEFTANSSHVTDVDFFPNSHLVASASRDGTARVWDTRTQKEKWRFVVQKSGIMRCRATADGKYLLTAGNDPTVRKWDVTNGEFVDARKVHTDQVRALNLSADGTRFVTAGRDGKAIVWQTDTLVPVRSIETDIIQVKCAGFSPDGSVLVTGGGDSNLKLWDLETGDQRAIFRNTRSSSSSVTFTPDGNALISGEEGRNSRITIRYATMKEPTSTLAK